MQEKDLVFLCCPVCGDDLQPEGHNSQNDANIARATALACQKCNSQYPIIEGIPMLAAGEKNQLVKVVTDSFGLRWTENYKNMEHLQHAYTPSLIPIRPGDFQDKTIIDAGCGYGPLTKFMLDNGAHHVLCIDYSNAIFTAKKFLEKYDGRVTFAYGDILNPPIKPVFDMFVSHGVLIHVEDAQKAYTKLSEKIRPQKGTSFIWVYAKENNAFLIFILNKIRTITLKIPYNINWHLAYFLEALLSLIYYSIYFPIEKIFKLGRKLWFGKYFIDFLYNRKRGGTRKYRYNMIHDALCTPIANHFSRDELMEWIKETGYTSFNFMFFRDQSWSIAASYGKYGNWNNGVLDDKQQY